jgi:hypothetical protein
MKKFSSIYLMIKKPTEGNKIGDFAAFPLSWKQKYFYINKEMVTAASSLKFMLYIHLYRAYLNRDKIKLW